MWWWLHFALHGSAGSPWPCCHTMHPSMPATSTAAATLLHAMQDVSLCMHGRFACMGGNGRLGAPGRQRAATHRAGGGWCSLRGVGGGGYRRGEGDGASSAEGACSQRWTHSNRPCCTTGAPAGVHSSARGTATGTLALPSACACTTWLKARLGLGQLGFACRAVRERPSSSSCSSAGVAYNADIHHGMRRARWASAQHAEPSRAHRRAEACACTQLCIRHSTLSSLSVARSRCTHDAHP